jgi:hypothetical protein
MFRLCLVLAALLNVAIAEISFEELKSKLPGHTVALRVPFKGSEIFFDLDGRPVPPYMKGTVGRDGFITVSDIRMDDRSNVILTGHRAALVAFSADEPLRIVNARDKVTIGFVVPSSSPHDIASHLVRVIHSVKETNDLITAYNLALKQPVKVGDRDITMDCKLRTMATPITRTLAGKKIEAKVIVNEFGEPDALAFRTGFKRGYEKEDAITSLWNWRFAPTRSNGKPVSCSHTLNIDTTKVSPLPHRY